jgi:hypothetical protein
MKANVVHAVDANVARLLSLGLSDSQFELRVQEWQELLGEGQLTEEMRQVFVALGWLTARDRRVTKAD